MITEERIVDIMSSPKWLYSDWSGKLHIRKQDFPKIAKAIIKEYEND